MIMHFQVVVVGVTIVNVMSLIGYSFTMQIIKNRNCTPCRCEECSDEAIHLCHTLRLCEKRSDEAIHLCHTLRLCEKRSDEAIHLCQAILMPGALKSFLREGGGGNFRHARAKNIEIFFPPTTS